MPNIFLAQPSDFTAATQRIYRSGARTSHIDMPVVGAPRDSCLNFGRTWNGWARLMLSTVEVRTARARQRASTVM